MQTPVSQPEWQFVTFNHPLNAKTESNRRRVRSHATRHYHQQSRALSFGGHRALRKDEVEVDITPLLTQSVSHSDALEVEEQEVGLTLQHQPPHISPGSDLFDPFFSPPVQMSHGDFELYHHLFDQSCVMFRTMQYAGFLTRIQMTTAFRQLLAMSSWHLVHLNQTRPRNEYLRLSLSATQALQEQINDPSKCCTDNAIGAVLLFACCANLMHDTESFAIHMNGLKLMLNVRGGIETLDSCPGIKVMLHWADVNGSYFQDVPPVFPTPIHLLPAYNREVIASLSLENGSSTTEISNTICLAIHQIQDLIYREMFQRDVWNDPIFQGMHIIPVLGQILALRPINSEGTESTCKSLEAFRLAAILYISALRARFGVDTTSWEFLYAGKLRDILSSEWSDQNTSSSTIIWILALSYASQCKIEEKGFFWEALMGHTTTSNIVCYADLENKLKTIVWDADLLVDQSRTLRALFNSGG